MLRAALAFVGCKLNRYEIQAMSESLESSGFEIVPFNDKADCYVINTCSVTAGAEVSSRQMIHRARRTSPGSKIVVTGCYAQLKPEEIERIGVDLVVTNAEKERLPSRIADLFGESDHLDSHGPSDEFGSSGISTMGDLTRGFVKIQEGCDRKCTYCTIWMSRGPVRSRRPEFVIREVIRLYENGYKEIVLTGVHIGKYSFDGLNLPDLVQEILERTNIPRLRLSSLHPSEADDRLIRLIASNRRICPHVHLSIQSGDDDVLGAMGRDYTRAETEALVDRLRLSVPDITIGADIIVGFPGETEAKFENSRAFVEESGINHLHVFPFSSRPNTKAATMPAEVFPREKERRARILRNSGRRIKADHLKSFVKRDLEVLFEKRDGARGGRLTGLSGNYLRVLAEGPGSSRGKIMKVRPFKVEGGTLLADIVC